jgi:hypothetical protein
MVELDVVELDVVEIELVLVEVDVPGSLEPVSTLFVSVPPVEPSLTTSFSSQKSFKIIFCVCEMALSACVPWIIGLKEWTKLLFNVIRVKEHIHPTRSTSCVEADFWYKNILSIRTNPSRPIRILS